MSAAAAAFAMRPGPAAAGQVKWSAGSEPPKDVFGRVPSPIVFDHLAHIPQPAGAADPLFAVIIALIDKGKTWVKLSGAYADTRVGPPTYADASAVARAYVKAAPERLVWGSDWPHPSEKVKPDDALLLDLLLDWAPDEAVRTRILTQNPEEIYAFPKGRSGAAGPPIRG
jgi:predicted TIM-barrel fold metal-dependent hydrolase